MIGTDIALDRLNATMSVVLIDGAVRNIQVLRASGSFKENEHAQMSLFVASATRSQDFALMPGQRIEFDFGFQGNDLKFQGYVADVTQHHRVTHGRTIDEQEISCLGPTMVFKGNQPRFFSESTITQAIARVVADSSLGFSDEYRRDTTTWRSLAQTNETDWEMIVSLAGRLGARVVVTRGVVRLVDAQEIMYRVLPTRHYRKSPHLPSATANPMPPDGLIIDFSPTNQSTIDPIYSAPRTAYLTGGTAVEHMKKAGRRFSLPNFATSLPAHTVEEADVYLNGFYIPDWVQSGVLRVVGDATVFPATVIHVSTTGPGQNVMSSNFDGAWYVRKVSHEVIPQAFTTTLDIGRAYDRAPNWRSEIPFWLGDRRGVPSLFPNGTGRWLSTWRQTL